MLHIESLINSRAEYKWYLAMFSQNKTVLKEKLTNCKVYLTNVSRRFSFWIRSGKIGWEILLGILITYFLALIMSFLIDSGNATVNSYWGFLLEIIGTLTAILGLNNTLKQFDKTSIFDSICSWFSEFRLIFSIKDEGKKATSMTIASSGSSASSIVTVNKSDLESRVEILEDELRKLSSHSKNERTRIENIINEYFESSNQESQLLKGQLTEFATGGFKIQIQGFIWLMCGLFLSGPFFK